MEDQLHLAPLMHTWFSSSVTVTRLPPLLEQPQTPAWENKEMGHFSRSLTILRTPRVKAAAIATMIVAVALTTWFTSPRAIALHNVLHHLNFLPFMMAGMLFGWRGAVKALLFGLLIESPIIARHWTRWPMDAEDQLLELAIFGSAGIIAGLLADRERVQRLRVESTKRELENVYTELRENVEKMKKTERLSAAGQLAASLAHEIRNPLASISGAAGILKRGNASADNRQECLGILEKESQRLNKLLTNFLDFARPRLPRYQRVDPCALVESVTVLARHAAIRQQVAIIDDLPRQLPLVDCDAEQMKQVLLNIVLNAIQATQGGGRVVVKAFTEDAELCVEIRDEGCGMTPEELDRMFEPFFTTKESGTGLGLAVAANIVEQHGGLLSAENNPDRGMTFRLNLPLERAQKMAGVR
ncbi:sensor histidine kinase [Edaphobacter sp. HDX4]|uniref:sensor histidine kinase n=1 Tax=Edaphobacter sp. HDX4 TaxID=2794064 RepID=UPI002FE5B010